VTVFCLYLIANLFVASHADTAPLIRDRDLVPFLQRAPLLREQLEEVYKTCIDLGLSEASATQIMEEVVKTGTRDSSKRDQALETLQKKPRVYEADLDLAGLTRSRCNVILGPILKESENHGKETSYS
jgi:hypothetical protein